MKEVLAKLARPLRQGEVEDLRGLVIEESIALAGARLPHLDFSGTVFNAPVALTGCTFQGLAWFTDCSFNAVADFSGARFLGDARFDRACLRRGATFSGCEFHGIACFDGAEFVDAAYLDRLTCYANVSLDATAFGGVVSLEDSECFGGLWCNRTCFAAHPNTRGLEVHGRTWLVGSGLGEGEQSLDRLVGSIRSYGYRWL